MYTIGCIHSCALIMTDDSMPRYVCIDRILLNSATELLWAFRWFMLTNTEYLSLVWGIPSTMQYWTTYHTCKLNYSSQVPKNTWHHPTRQILPHILSRLKIALPYKQYWDIKKKCTLLGHNLVSTLISLLTHFWVIFCIPLLTYNSRVP